ncbi:MAG: hypothetical protein OXB99_04210 [Acidimicrobiaceae bacterium]|nr:hypothetical protein [Acidimicrobiaceae bacterium]
MARDSAAPECAWWHGWFYKSIWAADLDNANEWAEFTHLLYSDQ